MQRQSKFPLTILLSIAIIFIVAIFAIASIANGNNERDRAEFSKLTGGSLPPRSPNDCSDVQRSKLEAAIKHFEDQTAIDDPSAEMSLRRAEYVRKKFCGDK